MPEIDEKPKANIIYLTDEKQVWIIFPKQHYEYWLNNYARLTHQQRAAITINGVISDDMIEILHAEFNKFPNDWSLKVGNDNLGNEVLICKIKDVAEFNSAEIVDIFQKIFKQINENDLQFMSMSLTDIKQRAAERERASSLPPSRASSRTSAGTGSFDPSEYASSPLPVGTPSSESSSPFAPDPREYASSPLSFRPITPTPSQENPSSRPSTPAPATQKEAQSRKSSHKKPQ